jgi:hypothetical protein
MHFPAPRPRGHRSTHGLSSQTCPPDFVPLLHGLAVLDMKGRPRCNGAALSPIGLHERKDTPMVPEPSCKRKLPRPDVRVWIALTGLLINLGRLLLDWCSRH